MITEERLAAIQSRVRMFPGGDALIDGSIPAASDYEQSEMARRLRSRFLSEQGRTHWPSCWREHYVCAMNLIHLMHRAIQFMNRFRPSLETVRTDGAAMGWGTVDHILERMEDGEVNDEA